MGETFISSRLLLSTDNEDEFVVVVWNLQLSKISEASATAQVAPYNTNLVHTDDCKHTYCFTFLKANVQNPAPKQSHSTEPE